MSMVINLVEDHNIYLCEGGPVYNGGVQPTPITYLTQWQIVGNSEVHTDEYLTQWKVEGNSVVDNNTILSCGDLGQDGKYHVKISNGVNIYDIPLDAPLRKVNDVADSIEFPSETEGKALVTRYFAFIPDLGVYNYVAGDTRYTDIKCMRLNNKFVEAKASSTNGLCSIYNIANTYIAQTGWSMSTNMYISFYDADYNTAGSTAAFKTHMTGASLIYELATPTTELVDAPQIAVSPTDTYTSANVTPYSAFTFAKNSEIWSCGEYNPIDGKYHILVQPLGGSIADIALTEPLRKVNDVADTIEFPSDTDGKALVTRRLLSQDMGSLSWSETEINESGIYRLMTPPNNLYKSTDNVTTANILCTIYNAEPAGLTYNKIKGCAVSLSQRIFVYDPDYNQSDSVAAFTSYVNGYNVILELATPTTELVDAPQIEEADSYTCVISQGGKAVSWSSFDTE